MSNAPELLPCPFCGGLGRVDRDHCSYGMGIFYAIKCNGCGVKSSAKFASFGNDCPQLYQEVRDLWNTRADLPPTTQKAE